MKDVVISGTGLYRPPHIITNAELVEAFNAYAALQNEKNAQRIAAGDVEPMVGSSVEFIENGIVMQTMGKDGLGWTPFLLSLFFFLLVVNLFGGDHHSFERNRERIADAFDGRVLSLPPVEAGNLVVLAMAGPPLLIDAAMLFERAAEVERRWRLPARGWAKALRSQVVG